MADRDQPTIEQYGRRWLGETLLADEPEEGPDRVQQIAPGVVLGKRFEILSWIGEGGAGTVYAARDQLLGEDIALKVLHGLLGEEGADLDRLRAEVRAARRIAHPNVCRVHDLSEHEGQLLVAMELLQGETLRRRMRRTLSAMEALDFARQLGAGLAAAHRVGVVHCDVKPDNVILVDGRVVLTDFGIARIVGRRRAEGAPRSIRRGGGPEQRRIEGTPAYMSPEQLLGQPVDERTDVYGLAAVVCEMLCGEPPFGEPTGAALTFFRRVLTEPPALPDGAPSDVSEAARAALCAVLTRGLAKEAEDRYESVEALVAALIAAAGAGGEGARAERGTRDVSGEWAVLTASTESKTPTRATSRALGRARALRRMATAVHVLVHEREGEDEDRAAERADALLDAAEAALSDAGGLLIGHGPRAVSAAFGAMGSSGDEPQRAADVARALVVAAEAEREVTLRAGIDTGRVLVRSRAGALPAISGEALGEAERLAAGAAPAEVRVSARTARHLRRRFELRAIAGSDACVIAARRRAAIGEEHAQLVGREREVAALSAEILGAARDGRPGSALVLGPRGIGKSRLSGELVEIAASRGLRVVAVAAQPGHVYAGFGVLGALLRELCGLPPQPSAYEANAAAQRALAPEEAAGERGDEPPSTQVIPYVRPEVLASALAGLLGEGGGEDASIAAAAAKAALSRAAAERPLLIVLDDAHWADDGTLDVVEALARGEVEAPLVVLVLSRTALLERRARARRAFTACVELAPLSREDAAALAAVHLGEGADAATARTIAEAAEGSPFFIEELARDRLERGERGDAVPSTVEEAIQARLDRLDDAEREVLRAASVLGRVFRRRDLPPLLSAGQSGTGNDALDTALSGLCARAIVLPLPPSDAGDDRYAIKHALLCDVAYGELAAAERRALHAAAARAIGVWLAAEPDAGAGAWAELARHHEGAEERPAAAGAYRRAGGLAAAQGAPGEAVRCFMRARELAGPAVDVDLLIRLGEAATEIGAHDDAQAALDEAIARSERDPAERRDLVRALYARACVAREHAKWADAVALLRRGVALVEGDPVLEARLRGMLGWVLGYSLGDNDQGLPESLRAVELLSGTGELAELANAYSRLGANYMRAGRWLDQLRCNERNLEIGERLGAIDLCARAHVNLGVCLMGLGRLEEAADHTRRATAIYERLCATPRVALGKNNLGCVLIELGDLDGAEREIDAAMRLSDRCGGLYMAGEAEITRARIHAKRGDLAAARAGAERAVARAVAEGGKIDEGTARRVLGAILALSGAHDEAAVELDAAERVLADSDLGEHARARAARARALSLRGDREGAERVRAEVRATLERLGAGHDLAQLDRDDWI